MYFFIFIIIFIRELFVCCNNGSERLKMLSVISQFTTESSLVGIEINTHTCRLPQQLLPMHPNRFRPTTRFGFKSSNRWNIISVQHTPTDKRQISVASQQYRRLAVGRFELIAAEPIIVEYVTGCSAYDDVIRLESFVVLPDDVGIGPTAVVTLPFFLGELALHH